MTSSIKLFANTSKGTQVQVEFFGDLNKIMRFIEGYEGDDLGNELILQDFVTDTKHADIEIEY